MLVQTPQCISCGQIGYVDNVQEKDYKVWMNGLINGGDRPLIQDLFPYLNADQREQLMTGTHPACWNQMFNGI